ncbi:MAG: leucine-rich repeat domain-containing protein [Alphaproteobacteria bacterium]|nr:leucine-rich repeat domain-containing protein [Alphaproteobacteria bacterium]
MKKKILVFTLVLCWQSNAMAIANCPQGTTENVDCWSCGVDCTAYLSNIKDEAGNIVKVSGTETASQKLTVIGTGDMQNYSPVCDNGCSSTSPWYTFRDSITDIKVEGLDSVGGWAFSFMNKVSSVELSEGLKEIKTGAFFENSSLTSIEIPDSVESISDAFNDCGLLSSVKLPSSLKTLDASAFSNAAIENIVIPTSVTSVSADAFGNATSAGGYYSKSKIINVYCNEEIANQCEAAVQWKRDLGKEVNVIPYQKDGHQIFYNNHWYNSANDILFGTYLKKRVYTVEEAQKVSKKTGNTFKLRYK